MPLTDSSLTLSVAQAVTVTAFSTNTIDLGPGVRDIGVGEELNVLVRVGTAFTAAGAATLNIQLVTSASANLSTPTIIGQTDAIPKANLGAGALIEIPIPESLINNLGQRYFGLQYTVGTGPMTAGTVDAYVLIDDMNKTTNSNNAIGPTPTGQPGTGFAIR